MTQHQATESDSVPITVKLIQPNSVTETQIIRYDFWAYLTTILFDSGKHCNVIKKKLQPSKKVC